MTCKAVIKEKLTRFDCDKNLVDQVLLSKH
jgi:hypothetical protein